MREKNNGNNIDIDPQLIFFSKLVILNESEPKVDARRG